MRLKCLILVLMLAALMSLQHASCSYESAEATIDIGPGGLAHVTIEVHGVDSYELTVQLIGAPDPDFILVYDSDGTPLSYDLGEEAMTVYPVGSTTVFVEYLTYSLCSMSMGVWTVSLQSPYNFTLILPEDAQVTYVSDAPIEMSVVEERLSMSFEPGSYELDYILPTTPPSGEGGSGGGSGVEEQPLLPPSVVVPAALAVVVVVAVVVVFASRRRREVSGVEAAILDYLKSRGGSAFQDDIARDLALPKSTLSRAIASLRGKGLVNVRKVSRRNYVSLA